MLIITFSFIAINTTKSATINKNTLFSRTIYPNENIYELNIDFEDNSHNAQIDIVTRDKNEVILNENTILFSEKNISNSSETITIDIGDNVEQLKIIIRNNNDNPIIVNSINLVSTNNIIEVPMSYKFIPENIANRIQGLQTNNSAITRQQYFSDSLKLFFKNPIIGRGLGGFENGVQSVQQYQYETKYAHNHFLQVMVDGGIIALISYISILCTCIYSLFKSRKTNNLAPMLFGASMMIIIHGANEFSMSSIHFLPFAFAIFALIAVTSDTKISKLNTHCSKIFITIVSCMIIFSLLLGGNILANIKIKSGSLTFDSLEQCTKIDIYEHNDYMLSYILSSNGVEDEHIKKVTQKYLSKLEKTESNTISLYLAEYYINLNNPTKAFEQINLYIECSLYDPNTWNNAFNKYFNTLRNMNNISNFYDNRDIYIEQIESLLRKLDEVNQSSISEITITDENKYVINNVLSTKDMDRNDFLTIVAK